MSSDRPGWRCWAGTALALMGILVAAGETDPGLSPWIEAAIRISGAGVFAAVMIAATRKKKKHSK